VEEVPASAVPTGAKALSPALIGLACLVAGIAIMMAPTPA